MPAMGKNIIMLRQGAEMTNREWLENIGVPDEMIRCDEYAH
jgi:hypothetical protein